LIPGSVANLAKATGVIFIDTTGGDAALSVIKELQSQGTTVALRPRARRRTRAASTCGR
jgi:hypothetical protein